MKRTHCVFAVENFLLLDGHHKKLGLRARSDSSGRRARSCGGMWLLRRRSHRLRHAESDLAANGRVGVLRRGSRGLRRGSAPRGPRCFPLLRLRFHHQMAELKHIGGGSACALCTRKIVKMQCKTRRNETLFRCVSTQRKRKRTRAARSPSLSNALYGGGGLLGSGEGDGWSRNWWPRESFESSAVVYSLLTPLDICDEFINAEICIRDGNLS